MGNSCTKKDPQIIRAEQKELNPQRRPVQKKTSTINIRTGPENPYTDALCPIDNLDIFDARELIDHQNPFKTFLSSNVKPIYEWNRIEFKESKNDGKYWFYGNLLQDKIDGEGIIFYKGKYSEYIVEGTFKNNQIIPDNIYLKIFENGNAYMGTLNTDFSPEGQGEMLYESKDKYSGEFKHGLPHGSGQKKSAKTQFVGIFEKGEKKNGNQKEEKGTYEGQFKDNMKDGEGIFTTHKGQRYVGQYKKNKRNGYGRLFNSKGDIVYKGFWKDDSKIKN